MILDKQYHRETYNCAHFVADLWKHETGQDIGRFILRETPELTDRHVFRRVKPKWNIGPLLVLMRSVNAAKKLVGETHAGVYLRGRIWHFTPAGFQCLPPDVATLGYNDVRYYEHK